MKVTKTQRNWIVGGAAIAAVALTVFRTSGLDLVAAAQVWSAVGTVTAVVVALALALSQRRKEVSDEARRAAAAAVLLSGNAYALRASLSSIADRADYLKRNKMFFEHWLSSASKHLKDHPQVVEDKYLPYAVDLPPMVLFNLTVTHRWLENFKNRFAFADGTTLDTVEKQFSSIIDEMVIGYGVVSSATDQLHALSQVPGPAPWNVDAPSWAKPPDLGPGM